MSSSITFSGTTSGCEGKEKDGLSGVRVMVVKPFERINATKQDNTRLKYLGVTNCSVCWTMQ